MATVTVYVFSIWDHEAGENKCGARMATMETLQRIGGVPIDGTARSVDEADVDGNGFDPRPLDVTLPTLDVRNLVAFQLGGGLSEDDIDRFVLDGFLKLDGVYIILTARGDAALLQHHGE